MCIRDSLNGEVEQGLIERRWGDGDAQMAGVGDVLGNLLGCLLYTSDAADERSSVDLGGRRIIKKKNSK